MRDSEKTKEQLIEELEAAKQEAAIHCMAADNSSDFIMRYDRHGRHIYANRAALEVTRLPRDEYIGKTHREMGFPEDLCELWAANIEDVFETGRPTIVEFSVELAEGSMHLELKLHPEMGADGTVATVLGVSRDITERKRAEEQLREKSYIIQSSSSVIATADLDGKMTFANPAFFEAWGVDDAGHVLGRPFSDFWVIEERFEEIMEALREKGEWSDETKARRQDGTLFDVHVSAAMVTNSQNEPLGLTSTSMDITERKQAEEEQRLQLEVSNILGSESNLHTALTRLIKLLIERIPEVDCGGVYLIHETTGELFLTAHEGLSRDFVETCRHPKDSEQHRLVMAGKAVFATFPQIVSSQDPVLTSEGLRALAVIPISCRGKVVAAFNLASRKHSDFSAAINRALTGLAVLIGGAVERTRSEEALSESEEKYSTFMDSVTDYFAITNKDEHLTYVNRAMADGLGYTKEELIGIPLATVISEESLAKFAVEVEQLVSEGYLYIETTWLAKDGREILGELSVTAMYDTDGEYSGSRGVLRDITDRRRLEEQLLQSQKMEAVGTLAGGVAHDMNNVLAVVLGLGSVLKKEMGPDDPKTHDIQEIMSAAIRGKSLVENLLGFARKGKYQRESSSLNEVVRELIKVLSHSLPKKVLINTSLDDQLDAVECDSVQITQTLMNLCLNANDALDGQGAIAITTNNEALGSADVAGLQAGRYAKLQIRDNGPGMDEETCQKAFEPFFTTKDVGKGTGLGLSMAYGVIENHGGVIQIDSSLGNGTAVNIWLPAVEQEEAQEAQEASKPDLRQHKAKVLLVDDEEMIRTTGKRMISAAGYDVTLADSGSFAVDAYRNNAQDIDLVLLDLSMPVMDGAECFEKLKEIGPAVRVLICTGHGNRQDTEEMVANGALGVVRKPFDLDQLSEAIESALRVKG